MTLFMEAGRDGVDAGDNASGILQIKILDVLLQSEYHGKKTLREDMILRTGIVRER